MVGQVRSRRISSMNVKLTAEKDYVIRGLFLSRNYGNGEQKSAYRTVPTDAILATAGIPPIQVRVRERCCTYDKGAEEKIEAREELLEAWQQHWWR
jgi:hypothetical protein